MNGKKNRFGNQTIFELEIRYGFSFSLLVIERYNSESSLISCINWYDKIIFKGAIFDKSRLLRDLSMSVSQLRDLHLFIFHNDLY